MQFSTPSKQENARLDFSALDVSPVSEQDSSTDTDTSSVASEVELSDSNSTLSISGGSGIEHYDSEGEAWDEDTEVELNQSEDCNVLPNISLDGCDGGDPVARAAHFNSQRVHEHSTLSVKEAILEVMNLYLKNKQSKRSLNRCIKTMCKLLPANYNLPTSSLKILKYIQSLAPPVTASKHYYCTSCLYYHGTDNSGRCEVCEDVTEFNYFYYFDIASLLKYYFETRNLAAIFDQVNDNPETIDGLKTLRDGSVYKRLNLHRSKYDANLIVNSDDVRIRKGSPKELWLLLCTIAEVPLHLQKSYITVIGVWYDEPKPDMHTFLKPYAEQMKILHEEGFQWSHPSTKEIQTTRVLQPLCVCDAPARAKIQNLMGFNSRYVLPSWQFSNMITHKMYLY